MKRFVFALLIVQLLVWVGLLLLLSACSASLLPTVPVTTTATAMATRELPQITAIVVTSSPPPLVTITGNVNVRDASGAVVGWLVKGDRVNAVCRGQWCAVVVGQHAGYKFWRGCSDNNPDSLGCLEAE